MAIAEKITQFMERSSWIRKMFEEGAALKAQYGADQVCDFTLGNPDVAAPDAVEEELGKIVREPALLKYGYMHLLTQGLIFVQALWRFCRKVFASFEYQIPGRYLCVLFE